MEFENVKLINVKNTKRDVKRFITSKSQPRQEGEESLCRVPVNMGFSLDPLTEWFSS